MKRKATPQVLTLGVILRRVGVASLAVVALAAIVSGFLPNAANAAGAIVSSPDHHLMFWKTHRPSTDLAVGLALGECSAKVGAGCQVLSTFVSGCLAVAEAPGGSGRHGWALRTSQHEAELVALGECAKRGEACSLRDSECE
jgi:hypothetical protein